MRRTPAPGHNGWNWKPGVGEFRRWHGVALDGDPSSIAADQLRMKINTRGFGGDVGPRPGLTKVNQTAIGSTSACLEPWEYNIPPKTGSQSPYKLWILGRGLGGCTTTDGHYCGSYDQDQNPAFSRVAWYENTINEIAIGKFDNQLLIGADDALRRLNLLALPYGKEQIAAGGRATDPRLHKFTGWMVKRIQQFDGSGFVALSDGSAGKMALWNGVTAYDGTAGTTADLTGINPPTALGIWRQKLVVGFGSAYNRILLRSLGTTTPGTYATVTPSAGTVATVDLAQGPDGNLYIADGGTDVWRYNGTTLSSFRTIAGASAVTAVWWFNGFLYVGWNTASAARIARYDGTSWVDSHKDLTAQTGPPNLSNARTIKRLQGFRGKLYAVGNTASQGGRIWASPDLNTSGTWTEIVPNAANNGDVFWALAA